MTSDVVDCIGRIMRPGWIMDAHNSERTGKYHVSVWGEPYGIDHFGVLIEASGDTLGEAFDELVAGAEIVYGMNPCQEK